MNNYQNNYISIENMLDLDNVSVVSLLNRHNISVKLITTGASICEVNIPDSQDKFTNIALSLNQYRSYGKDPSFAGATLGPSAGRIASGKLPIDEKTHILSTGNLPHHLHGGKQNLSNHNWKILYTKSDAVSSCVCFELKLPDQLEGYPGNRTFRTTYTLTENDELQIEYEAVSDQDTYFNLSNHCYWNLSGDFLSTCYNHNLCIQAQRVCLNSLDHIPEKTIPVASTAYDFRADPLIESNLQPLLNTPPYGLNNAFVFDGDSYIRLSQKSNRRALEIRSNYPSILVYSGGYLNCDTIIRGNIPAQQGCAIAFEPQEIPVINFEKEEYLITKASDVWKRWIHISFKQGY